MQRIIVEITPQAELEIGLLSLVVNAMLDTLADSLPEEVRLGIAQLRVHTNDTEFLASASGEGLNERRYSEELDKDEE